MTHRLIDPGPLETLHWPAETYSSDTEANFSCIFW